MDYYYYYYYFEDVMHIKIFAFNFAYNKCVK